MKTKAFFKEVGIFLLMFLFFYGWFKLFDWLFSFIHLC